MYRKANVQDISKIAKIYDRSIDAEEAGLTTTGWLRDVYPTEDVARASVERGDMYVYEEDGIVLASGTINQIQVDVYYDCDWEYKAPDGEVCVLHTLAVDPDARGKGLGASFVRFYEQLAKDRGCTVLRIDTNAINTRARALYAKLGYRERDIVPTVFNGIPGVDLVLMEKKL